MIDAVMDYHMAPLTCGVSKYNQQLARWLGVPVLPLKWASSVENRLVSVHWHEIEQDVDLLDWLRHAAGFDVLWHDHGDPAISDAARHVYHARELGAPSTIEGDATRGTIDVLSFGMAHKFQGPLFERLKQLLDATHEDYTVSVSMGIHEGTAWDAGFAAKREQMAAVFGHHLRTLGFLMDDGLARALAQTNVVALFYDPAVRANNTTLWAALEAGVPVITNLDKDSPKELIHERSIYNLAQLTEFPVDASRHREVRHGGRLAAQAYGWDRVIAALQAPVHA